jgi:hypothetical protein
MNISEADLFFLFLLLSPSQYLGATTLFSDVVSDLAVNSEDMAYVAHVAGGLENCLFLLKGLDALGQKFADFASLRPAVESERAKQLHAEAGVQAALLRPDTAGAARPASGVHVGHAIISETQLPSDSPLPPTMDEERPVLDATPSAAL